MVANDVPGFFHEDYPAGDRFPDIPRSTLRHAKRGRYQERFDFMLIEIFAYRLRNSDEFLDMGGGELLHGEGVCLIEWADRIGELLPKDHLRIEIGVTGERTRLFRCLANGPHSMHCVESVRQAMV